MANITYEKAHSMTVDQAKAALTKAFENDLDDFDLDARWQGNVCVLTGRGANGAFTVDANKVTFELKTSILVKASGIDPDVVEEEVRKRMDACLR